MKLINLLPKPKQQELRYQVLLRGLWGFVIISVFCFALVFLGQLGARLYLQSQASYVKSAVSRLREQVGKQENAQLVAQITGVNSTINDFKTLADATPAWSKVLRAFVALPPETVKITSFAADLKTKSVSITGVSPDRELVIELYNNILSDDKEFYGVDYPLENVAKPKNVNFHFTFYMRDDLLKGDSTP